MTFNVLCESISVIHNSKGTTIPKRPNMLIIGDSSISCMSLPLIVYVDPWRYRHTICKEQITYSYVQHAKTAYCLMHDYISKFSDPCSFVPSSSITGCVVSCDGVMLVAVTSNTAHIAYASRTSCHTAIITSSSWRYLKTFMAQHVVWIINACLVKLVNVEWMWRAEPSF